MPKAIQDNVSRSGAVTCAESDLVADRSLPRLYWITLSGIILASLLLRLHGLGDRSLWFDEAFSWMLADQFTIPEMLERTANDVHPPLYYFVLRVWIALFGSSELAMRSLSAVMGTCAALAAFVLVRECRRTEGAKEDNGCQRRDAWAAGILAAVACAFSASHIERSQELRMYSFATFLALLCAWALMRALASNLGRYWTLYALSATCLIYTLNYGLFTVLGHLAFTVGWLWKDNRKARPLSATGSRTLRAIAAFCLVAAVYSPWIRVLLAQKARVQESYWVAPISWASVPNALTDLFLPRIDETADRTWIAAALAALLIGAIAVFARVRDWRRNFLIVNALAPIACAAGVSLVFAGIVVPRQLLISYVFLLCILASLVAEVVRPRYRKIALAATIVLSLCIHWEYRSGRVPPNAQPGVRGAIADLMTRREEGEPILVLHPTLLPSVTYYLADGTTPRLFYQASQVRHYLGGPILRDSDFIVSEEIARIESNSLWTVGVSGISGEALASDWMAEKGTRRTFPEARRFLGDIVVMRHVRRSP